MKKCSHWYDGIEQLACNHDFLQDLQASTSSMHSTKHPKLLL